MTTLPADALADLIAAKRADYGLPAVAAGIVADDDLAWFSGQGWADLETAAAPTERSLGRVASVTKTFTATSILQMRDRGLLALDDPLERHLPEFAAVRERGGRRADVTIRRLLTHRSGLVTESPLTHWDGDAGPAFPSMPAIVAALPETAVVIPSDSAFKYSNLAFALLGEVVTRLGGRPYAEHVQAEILDPLGMRDTCFEADADRRAMLMTGYSPGDHTDRPTPAPTTSLDGLSAAGQLQTNVRDLAQWVAFQLRGGGLARDGRRLLSAAAHREAFVVQQVDEDFLTGQCLAWRVNRVGDRVFHNHGGSVHGFNTSVAFHRPSRIGSIVLTNLWPTVAAADLNFALLDTAVGGRRRSRGLGGSTGLPASADVTASSVGRPPSVIPTAVPDAFRRYLGTFRAEPGIPVRIEWRGDALRFTSPPGAFPLHTPAELAAIEGRTGAFLVVTGRAAGEEFTFDDAASTFELGGFRYRRRG